MEAFLFALILVLNLLSFFAFGIDKHLARREKQRIPEARLLLMAWLGGFLGAWLGIRAFRHKTRKQPFRRNLVLVSLFSPAWLLLYLEIRSWL
ncbi:MAG: DUF1294 domain-containing protein [Planctomycetota bacterium]|nr:MAG: DUF1294 domain-containing protein [Planctomycetota bacterium]